MIWKIFISKTEFYNTLNIYFLMNIYHLINKMKIFIKCFEEIFETSRHVIFSGLFNFFESIRKIKKKSHTFPFILLFYQRENILYKTKKNFNNRILLFHWSKKKKKKDKTKESKWKIIHLKLIFSQDHHRLNATNWYIF